MGYVSIFRRLSNAAIGRKGRFRTDTNYMSIHQGDPVDNTE